MSFKDLKKLIKKGDQLLIEGKSKSALKIYKEAFNINKNSKVSCKKIGDTYIKIEKYEKAINAYKRSLEIDSEDDTAYAKIGFAYEKLKDIANAKMAYKKALEIRPDIKSYKKSLKKIKSINKDLKRSNQVIQEKDKLKKLQQMVSVSDNINLDILMRVLKLDRKTFEDKIFDWAEKFGFRIDNNVLVINQATVNDFIDDITDKVSNEKAFCQFCGKLLKEKEIIKRQDSTTFKCSECKSEHSI